MERVGPPGRRLTHVEMCEAAAREVGAVAEFGVGPGGKLAVRGPASEADVVYRACSLAALAVFGPEHLVKCARCAVIVDGRTVGPVACTPVRDAIRGVTCSRGT